MSAKRLPALPWQSHRPPKLPQFYAYGWLARLVLRHVLRIWKRSFRNLCSGWLEVPVLPGRLSGLVLCLPGIGNDGYAHVAPPQQFLPLGFAIINQNSFVHTTGRRRCWTLWRRIRRSRSRSGRRTEHTIKSFRTSQRQSFLRNKRGIG